MTIPPIPKPDQRLKPVKKVEVADLPNSFMEAEWAAGAWQPSTKRLRAAAAKVWFSFLAKASQLNPEKIEYAVQLGQRGAKRKKLKPPTGKFYQYAKGRFPTPAVVRSVENCKMFNGARQWIRHPIWTFLDPAAMTGGIAVSAGLLGSEMPSPRDREITHLLRIACLCSQKGDDLTWIAFQLLELKSPEADVALIGLLRAMLAIEDWKGAGLVFHLTRPRVRSLIRESEHFRVAWRTIARYFLMLRPDRFKRPPRTKSFATRQNPSSYSAGLPGQPPRKGPGPNPFAAHFESQKDNARRTELAKLWAAKRSATNLPNP